MKGKKAKSKDIKQLILKDLFTTFDVANICQVNIASIKNWIAKNYLKAYRTPGGHYRIQKKHLISFIKKYNMPNPFENEIKTIFYYGDDADKIRKNFNNNYEFYAFDREKDLYMKLGKEFPSVLLLDTYSINEPQSFVEELKATPGFDDVLVVGIIDDNDKYPYFSKTVQRDAKKFAETIFK